MISLVGNKKKLCVHVPITCIISELESRILNFKKMKYFTLHRVGNNISYFTPMCFLDLCNKAQFTVKVHITICSTQIIITLILASIKYYSNVISKYHHRSFRPYDRNSMQRL